ncbi:MAG: hypothetical protein J7604_09170 [Sporocytophaga sp.]|uniref:hypothetical protein n=1 Tax=Sporocytophaga sp. TaxID=2231183 RepID=UPI001B2A239F|nr:hypothetical protein [Sporocytophaga sp.]MBO9700365.1 hypothetical protein [Sporocytophaga sp.]
MKLQKSATEHIGIVQANGISVLIDEHVYPVQYEYLCYTFAPGHRLKGELRIEPNIVPGSRAISPRYGLVTVLYISKGIAYFKERKKCCEVRDLAPISAPILVFIPQILAT